MLYGAEAVAVDWASANGSDFVGPLRNFIISYECFGFVMMIWLLQTSTEMGAVVEVGDKGGRHSATI